MTFPPLTYLTVDSLSEGVGRSQVLPYVMAFADRGLDVSVHSFEHALPDAAVAARLAEAGIHWQPYPFGRHGAAGGAARIARLVRAAWRRPLVHARSDLAAAAAMVGGAQSWIWDVRSLWADQRIELGMLRPGAPEERVLRLVERQSARRASAVVTLTDAVIPTLAERHGPGLPDRCWVVPTCVDLARFRPTPLPPPTPQRWLFSGSLNRYYDMPLMLRLLDRARSRRPTRLVVLSPSGTPWDDLLAVADVDRASAPPDEVATHVSHCHVGLAVCRQDLGDSLRAAMPTKLGEFLASGRPVIVSRGLGDMDRLIADSGCGVVVDGHSDQALDRALDQLAETLATPGVENRCRNLAEDHFDLQRGVDRLLELYRSVSEQTA